MQGVKWGAGFSRSNFRFWIPGSAVRFGVENDQCGRCSAPSAIQRRSVVISAATSVTLESADGIRSSANLDSIRWTTSLSSGFPGPIGIAPQLGLARGGNGPVALETFVREHRADVAVEIKSDGSRSGGTTGSERGSAGEK